MPNTNGHGPKRAILYARVSTDEQARSGYSLAQQLEALREYAAREGYEVLEEVSDPGQSGASLERPGMDRVRDLVAAGGVHVVLAQDRDRLAREPAYLYLLREEFAPHGCTLRALNDRGDDSPEGQLTEGILDQIARFERLKIMERSRRGKLRKVREGKLLAPPTPRYGFKLNAARDAYEIDEAEMEVIRRIFRMVGLEGRSPGSLARIFDREGVPRPKGTKRWDRSFFRECILADIYKPHSFEEVRTMVSAEVAARLDPEKRYGLWWFNRRGVKVGQVSETGPDGRRYRKTYRWHHKPKEEWVAVPVTDSGIPRELVEAARGVVESNRKPARAGRRFWELTGGIAYCGGCGKTMCANHSTKTKKGRVYTYDYYCCSQRNRYGPDVCVNSHRPRAGELEGTVWNLVSGLLKDPASLRAGLEELIEEERRAMRGNPDREAEAWAKKLAKVDSKRSGYQDQQAEGLITLDELRTKLADLEETRAVALKELKALRARREQLERLEHDADALLEHYAEMIPAALDDLTPEERRDVYKMMRLKVIAFPDGFVEVTGVFGGPLELGASRSTKTEDSWVSNPDADHIGGFLDVFDAFPVEKVYVSGDPNNTLTYNTFLRGVRDEGARTEILRTGALMDWGGVRADVIAPPTDAEGGLFSEINDNSVAILLTYGTARILLAGDAEANEEEYMANGPYTGPLTILKVTHHGSNTSSTPLFLSRFPPKVAVIQCGADNPYGHPTPETLDRLQRIGAKVFRNDEDGDVIATIKDQELQVATTKR